MFAGTCTSSELGFRWSPYSSASRLAVNLAIALQKNTMRSEHFPLKLLNSFCYRR